VIRRCGRAGGGGCGGVVVGLARRGVGRAAGLDMIAFGVLVLEDILHRVPGCGGEGLGN
jgi:hypothetical protein